MARRHLAVALSAALVLSAAPLTAASPPIAPQFASEILGGRTWLGDVSVTNNSVDDDETQLAVGGTGTIRFLWRQATGGNGSLVLAETSAYGQPAINESPITSNISAPFPIGSPHGDFAAIDSSNKVHVVREAGPLNIGYEQYDQNGSTLVGPLLVGPIDGAASWAPALAVAADGSVHVANEDYKFQCEDVVYAKLQNNGSAVWTMRVVSSDVAAVNENTIVRTDPFSGNVYYTFGSDQGSWVARTDRYGVKTMGSVKFRTATDGKPADVAATPNGSMHLVWEDGGNLFYTMVNASGLKIVDAQLLESNGTVGAFPRVAAASDGRLMVVWEDNRTGSSQVMVGEIPRDGNLSQWTSYKVTSSAGAAFDPVVAFDPDDQPIVAWTDTRDGDRDIYFKRAAGCGMELYTDPIDLSGLDFLHPNETNVTQFHLKNKGLLADGFAIDLTYSVSSAASGWTASIDPTLVDTVQPGDAVPVNLTVYVPPDAQTGDHIDLTVNATSVSWTDCWDRIDMSRYVRVTRSLAVAIANSGPLMADNGETVRFDLVATNTGDVSEVVEVLVPITPNGWNASSDPATFPLGAGERKGFSVMVTVPTEPSLAPANFLALITVWIGSTADPSVTAGAQLLVEVKAAFRINTSVEDHDREVAIGSFADYAVTISNVGNLAGQAQINVALDFATPGVSAVLDRETIFLRGGEATVILVRVSMLQNATPGAAHTVVVDTYAPRFGVAGNASLVARAPPLCRGGLSVGEPDPPAVGYFSLWNTGAFPQTFAISFVDLPAGWTGTAKVGGGVVTAVVVPVNGTVDLAAEVTADSRALAGTHSVTVQFVSSDCGAYEETMEVMVAPFLAFSIESIETNATAPAGGTAHFVVRARNDGNALTAVGLMLLDEASGAEPAWWFVDTGGEFGSPSNGTAGFALSAFSNLTLHLFVPIPADPPVREYQFRLTATAGDGVQHALELHFALALPDLGLTELTVTPALPGANQTANVSVSVTNRGTAASREGDVRFLVDGVLVGNESLGPLAGNSTVTVVFPWLPSAGTHVLTVEVWIGEGEHEVSSANNAATATLTVPPPEIGPGVQPPPPAPPMNGEGAFSPLVAGGLVVGLAALLAALAFRARRRGPPPNP